MIDWDSLPPTPDDWLAEVARKVAESCLDRAAVLAEWGRDDLAALCRENAALAVEIAEEA